MFELRHLSKAFGVAAALSLPAAVPAQAKRPDSTLAQQWIAAEARTARLKAEAYQRDSIAQNVIPQNQIVEGFITIRFDSALLGPATQIVLRHAARAASRQIVAVEGEGARRTIGSLLFAAVPMRREKDVRSYVRLRTIGKIVSQDETWSPAPGYQWEFENFFRRAAVWQASNIDSSRWVTPVVPQETMTAADWTQVAEWVLAAQSETTMRCVNGNADACATVLGVEPHEDKLAAFYGPRDYPSLVEAIGIQHGDPDSIVTAVRRCIKTADPTACATSVARVRVGDPVPAQARLSLISVALARGGRQAFDRYLNTAGTTRERLVAAAGIPADSLFLLWRSRVLASRPSHDVTSAALSVLGWSLLFGLMSMRRPKCG